MKSERCSRDPERAGLEGTSTAQKTCGTIGHRPRPLGISRFSPFTFHLSPFTKRLLLLLGFLLLASPSLHAASVSAGAYPADPASYHDDDVTFIPAQLWGRVQSDPLNLIATVIFALAITHTFLAAQFQKRSRSFEHRLLRLEEEQADPNLVVAEGKRDHLVFWAQFYHFMGEIEAVFGIWLIPLFLAIILFKGWDAMVDYVGHVNVADPVFVVVIMAIAGSLPILRSAETAISQVAKLGRSSPDAWWLSILTIGPILGSFITEPAAMTICALLLRHRFYNLHSSSRLKYATLGLLFVNISVGGTLTHFAAPPVVLAASAWKWDMPFMMANFGWKAVIAIIISNILYWLAFRKEFSRLNQERREFGDEEDRRRVPWSITLIHLLFLVWTVISAHYPVLVVLGFLFFLAFVSATRHNQQGIALRPPLLVGFFLASLVIHGGCQSWWIGPVLKSLSQWPLMICATALTALNDNAAITYLATLVPGFPDSSRYAVMAGAVTGGGLTVIANAPNPAGQSILASRFGEAGISPLGLFLGALVPTVIVGLAFMLL
ncbi:MAG: putative Na+/H+ antiporter [Chthoniobacterales bacterium]